MKSILFLFEKLFVFFTLLHLFYPISFMVFLACSLTLLILSLTYQGAKPITPLFIIIIILESFQFHLLNSIVIVITGILGLLIKFYHVSIPLKGPYMVGHKYKQVSDNNNKKVLIAIYYPTNQKGTKVSWLPTTDFYRILYDMLYIDPNAFKIPFPIFKWLSSFIQKIHIPVQGNTKYLENFSNKNRNKVIIFSHGLGAHLNGYSSCCCSWASNGYIVITINHCHDQVSIGQASQNPDEIIELEHKRRLHDLLIRYQEIKMVIDQVLDTKMLDVELQSNFKLQQIVLGGHSYGGVTALATKALLRKMLPQNHQKLQLFKRIICFEPWLFPLTDQLFDALNNENILIVNSQYFNQWVPQAFRQQKLFARLKSISPQLKDVMVTQMDHLASCDMPYIFGNVLKYNGSVRFHNYSDQLMSLNILLANQFLESKNKEELIQIGNKYLEKHKLSGAGFNVQEQYRVRRQLIFKKSKD